MEKEDKDKRVMTSVYLPKELKDKFTQLCKEQHLIGTRVMEEMIKEWVKKQEEKSRRDVC